MSRVGKHAISLPSTVTVTQDGDVWHFKGKLGQESLMLPRCLKIEQENGHIKVVPFNQERETRSQWGTAQRNITNIIKGITEGFHVNLELVGVGYKASVAGRKLVMQLGFSHEIEFAIPQDVDIVCEKPTSITVKSPSKQLAGAVAAVLRSYRKPEPYKGKGIIREGEFVVRKEGKKK